MTDFNYIGTELEVFAGARNWKSYVRERLRSYIAGRVLEVGAGIGSVTLLMNDGSQRQWVCLEPDKNLAERIKQSLSTSLRNCEVIVGTLADLGREEKFDVLLYMDVLEHIEDDRDELYRAASYLEPGGHLIVLAPAWQWLSTPFDNAIGHFRRYTKSSLRKIVPKGLAEERFEYLDSVGMLASAGNCILLRSSTPTSSQIRFWDRFLVPLSRVIDPVLVHSLGRSVLAIWKKTR